MDFTSPSGRPYCHCQSPSDGTLSLFRRPSPPFLHFLRSSYQDILSRTVRGMPPPPLDPFVLSRPPRQLLVPPLAETDGATGHDSPRFCGKHPPPAVRLSPRRNNRNRLASVWGGNPYYYTLRQFYDASRRHASLHRIQHCRQQLQISKFAAVPRSLGKK